MLRLSVTASAFGRICGPGGPDLPGLGAVAEAAGIDSLVVPDHVVMGADTSAYPYGRFPYASDEPWYEPFVVLSMWAARTERMRLGTGILIVPLRPPALLAKQAATLDALSGGRLDLGVGTGWQRAEYDACGVAWAGRAARMQDTLRACRALWTGADVSFESPTVAFDAVRSVPVPAHTSGPTLHYGVAASDAWAERIAELGDGWLPIAGMPLADVAAGAARVRAAFAAKGRDPATLHVRAGAVGATLDDAIASLDALAAAGVTTASFALARFARRPDETADVLRAIGAAART